MRKSARVAVIMGGASAEREVSLRSGEAVARALEGAGRKVARIDLSPGRDSLRVLANARMDVAFLALHGRLGEDGCVQGLLELMGVPYTGSSVMASALAMDKLKAKELFRLHNLPTPPYYVFCESDCSRDLEEAHGSFGFPVVVKPRREGSSVGLGVARNFSELATALDVALAYDRCALVERHIKGTEVAVGLLNGRVLGAIEVVPASGLYDYSSKYTPGLTTYHQPPRLPASRLRGIFNLAEHAASVLDTHGAVRVDLIVTEGQNEYLLEVNTLPGMTPTSLLPKIAEAAGMDFVSLCEALVESARLHVRVGAGATAIGEPPAVADADFGGGQVADLEMPFGQDYVYVPSVAARAVAMGP